jgi:uncharacterized membrane protein
MAKGVGSTVGSMLHGRSNGHGFFRKNKADPFSGVRKAAAGAALTAAVPLAGKAAQKLVGKLNGSPAEAVKKAGTGAAQKLSEGAKDAVGEKAPEIAKEAGKKMVPGIGGDGGKGKKGTPGVGKGRRMPVQQSVDISVPISVAYNQWTQFEEWPQFMHRLDQANQEDDCTVSFRTKVWGMSRKFVAQIVEQRPEERIHWSVTDGIVHTGVVTFHEIGPRLTRVQVSLDVEPGSLLEKAARGMRFVKRAVRADLARFKAFIEMQEVETGAWRGVIHDGELVKQHDRKYDRQRDYAEVDDIQDKESSHTPQREGRRKSASTRSTSRKRASRGRSSGARKSASTRSTSRKRASRGRSSGARKSASARSRGRTRVSGGRSSRGRNRARSSTTRKRGTSRS